ncbi:MAG: ATP-dependent DNA helicase RecG [Deltaproteobacteria bacterium]|nr:ATP-dependent DNA helicase RecG [Deltaproteobacteria bacterium]
MDLCTPVQYVKGVGPRIAGLLGRLGIATVGDLLWHLPARYLDRRAIAPIAELTPGKDRVVIGEVTASGVVVTGRRRTRLYEVQVNDGTGVITATWFHFYPKAMAGRFQVGRRVLLAGECSFFGGRAQFVHPESELLDAEGEAEVGGRILPIYPATEGLTQRMLRRAVRAAWEKWRSALPGGLPDAIRLGQRLISLAEAIEALHFPETEADVAALNQRSTAAHRTLIFDEVFYLELGLLLRRATWTLKTGATVPHRDEIGRAFARSLPFTLTAAQARVAGEIAQDMAGTRPMHRLVQGDVGCGKTVVAIGAALQTIGAGYQVAFMAPTELLAEQHTRTIRPWMEALKIQWALLTGATRGKERRQILEKAAGGDLPLLIGTHALIEEDVRFARLGLLIIDEQHRFGVAQRLALKQKGVVPHVLVMTATPIPRTLAMTIYGDLDCSIIDKLPPGRLPVVTKLYDDGQRARLYEGMRKELAKGHQIYVVYPLVEESEKVDLKNATDMAAALAKVFAPRYRVALLHGRMRAEEKEAIMRAFCLGEVHILAATTVVEVGVDVPTASVMVVEHAERFGLSQLHQLRGRVGRGRDQSFCILMANDRHSDTARARLRIMTETTDGFRIAEEDLKIRGPGEVMGTRQSGLPELRVAHLVTDAGIIATAREVAASVVAGDPALVNPEHAWLKRTVMERWGERLALGAVG